MTREEALRCVLQTVAEIFERDVNTLSGQTRLMQDLPCESIDLLEIAARLSQHLGREVDDEALFLRSLRSRVAECPQESPAAVLEREFAWLGGERIAQVVQLLDSPAPFVTLQDMADYLASL